MVIMMKPTWVTRLCCGAAIPTHFHILLVWGFQALVLVG